ncbi:ribosomal protein L17 [Bacteroidales bacterium KA00344]|nr:ribosomal protein L17 [Bacteroidales bacterium KA00344]
MLANMASSLIMHKRITTTLAKAKALKKYVEPLITRSKNDTTTSRRVVFRYLQNKYAVKELFGEVAGRVADRPGGYTRVIKLGTRKGDAAEIAFIELVDFDENMAKAPKAAKKTRRSRRSKKDESVNTAAENTSETVAEEDVKTEAKSEAKVEANIDDAKKATKSVEKKAVKSEKKAPKAETTEAKDAKAEKAE